MISENEKLLVTALQQDDQSAMKTIFQNYHAGLCRVSFKITGDSDTAKDVVQDVFLKLWQNRKSLNIQVSLEFYLKRAVVNTTLNVLERTKRKSSLETIDIDSVTIPLNVVEQTQNAQELSKKIDEVIQALPPRTKAVFTLIRFDEMSYREAAESLQISVKAVEKEMMKALNSLRQALKDYLPLFIILFL